MILSLSHNFSSNKNIACSIQISYPNLGKLIIYTHETSRMFKLHLKPWNVHIQFNQNGVRNNFVCLFRNCFRKHEQEESDLATAILRRKAAPNKLMVDESPQDNNSMIYLSENTLEKLGLFRSDSVLLKGKKRRETIAVVLASPDCDDNKIKMNKGILL